jgi:predicted dehydrogenase
VKPRLGFLGAGRMGLQRLRAIVASDEATVACVCDPDPAAARAAVVAAPGCEVVSWETLLSDRLEGVVIAMPSALNAEQACQALQRGLAVFCQKPLGRTGREARSMVEAARRADRLLAVDCGYRHLAGVEAVRQMVLLGELGELMHVELVFHDAHGPDKAWSDDPALAGGGCVVDLGTHLLDLLLWLLPGARVEQVHAQLHAKGRPLAGRRVVEDLAEVQLRVSSEQGAPSVRLACSWRLPAGQDAVIQVNLYGTRGGAAVRNVGGSFYDFTVERFRGTQRLLLAGPPDAWGGRAAVAFARQLQSDGSFEGRDAAILVDVADVVDRIYGTSLDRGAGG